MTRKDYIVIANVIYETRAKLDSDSAHEFVLHLINNLALELQRDNPRFDADRFYAACGWEHETR